MDNIRSALTISQSLKNNEPVNLTNTLNFYKEKDCVTNFNEYEIRLLHHNVQSLNNKLLDIAVMLTAEYLNVNILCFMEHWLLDTQTKVTNIDYFRLVSNFSRNHSSSGRSCIFIRNNTETKEFEYLRGLGKEKVFEIPAVELSEIDTSFACIYRSPDRSPRAVGEVRPIRVVREVCVLPAYIVRE